MIKPEQIPAAALEAGVKAYAEAEANYFTSQAEDLATAFLAMLEAWPGMYPVSYGGDEPPFLVLPLMENPDDKA